MQADVPTSFAVLGTATYGHNPDEATAFAMLDAYLEKGGNCIDTARCYSDWIPGERGRSEALIGRWLKSRRCRERVNLATKGGHPPMDAFDRVRMSRAELTADIEASRRALGVDRIDLYWLHRDDLAQPVEALLETLESFRARGWIDRYGASNFSVERLREAADVARKNGWDGFHASQPMACLGARHRKPMETPLLEVINADGEAYHRETQMPLFPYTSQAAGYYEKACRLGSDHPSLASHPFHTAGGRRLARRLGDLARTSGHSVSVLTLAWWRTKDYPVHPIIGCRTPGQLEDSFRALEVASPVLEALAVIDAD